MDGLLTVFVVVVVVVVVVVAVVRWNHQIPFTTK
jgi:hypothetical protein